MFLSLLSNGGMLIIPYLSEGLILDWILFRLTAWGRATQMAQLLRHTDQRKPERNKDVIRMLSNARNKTSFWIRASLWYQNGATLQNPRYIHVGDGRVDYGISYFLCRFRCFCSIIYKFICTSIPDHEDLAAFQLLLPSKDWTIIVFLTFRSSYSVCLLFIY